MSMDLIRVCFGVVYNQSQRKRPTNSSSTPSSLIFLPMSLLIHSCCVLFVDVDVEAVEGLRSGIMRGMVLMRGEGGGRVVCILCGLCGLEGRDGRG